MRPRNTHVVDGLTPKQLQVLRHVAAFHGRQRYSPTIAELAAQLDLSRSTVFEHIGELQRKSLLTTSPGRARSLRLTSHGRRLLSDEPTAHAASATREGVPLMGVVAAGQPLEAIENEEMLSLNSCFGIGGDLFALEVRGQSMVDEDIRPGDYIICRRSAVADNGELVVALIDETEATLKRFYREKDRVRLQPANADYDPIFSDNCRIEGVVIGLVRKL